MVDFKLSQVTMDALMRMLPHDETHGWGHHITILITVYWLAHGLSYSVVDWHCCMGMVPWLELNLG
ncbi:hypothetical protein PGIGA_G00082470, partial [Pangasianodon gigas]|nr:hypothetical protein [Pangasianodon gigas]